MKSLLPILFLLLSVAAFAQTDTVPTLSTPVGDQIITMNRATTASLSVVAVPHNGATITRHHWIVTNIGGSNYSIACNTCAITTITIVSEGHGYICRDSVFDSHGQVSTLTQTIYANMAVGRPLLTGENYFQDATFSASIARTNSGSQSPGFSYSVGLSDSAHFINDGSHSFRSEYKASDTSTGQFRAELIPPSSPTTREKYQGFAIMASPNQKADSLFAIELNGPYRVVAQFHAQDGRVPPLYITTHGNHYWVHGLWISDTAGGHYNSSFDLKLDTIIPGQWSTFQFYVKWSDWIHGDTTGACVIIFNGKMVLNYAGPLGYGKEANFPYGMRLGVYAALWENFPYGYTKVIDDVYYYDDLRYIDGPGSFQYIQPADNRGIFFLTAPPGSYFKFVAQ